MNAPAPQPRWPRPPRLDASLLVLLLALLAVNGAAVWGIVAARQSARAVALEDLRLRTAGQARALEAALATLRGDFIFLVQAPPLGKGLAGIESPDPTTRRWTQRDVEGALLLFLGTHPAVERILVRDPADEPQIGAGRRKGAPVLLRREQLAAPISQAAVTAGPTAVTAGEAAEPAGTRFTATWRLGGTVADQGRLEARIDARRLLAGAAPGFSGRLRLRPAAAAGHGGVATPVVDRHWTPPIAWTLQTDVGLAGAGSAGLAQSFEALAGRYRRTVGLNLAVIALSLLLGLLAFRQVRRAARLQAENEQQARVRELERQVQHSERLASVGRLAAGLAHEINNPLEGMANYLTLLEEDLRAGRPRDALALAGRVREGLERAASVTRKVLAFARPAPAPLEADLQAVEAGDAPGGPGEPRVDLGEVLGGAVEFVRTNPAFRPIELSLAAAGPLPVAGNPTTLGQLFLNLLLNACQAQPQGGRVEVTSRVEGTRVVVAVADRGPGIPAEVAGRLFEPFVSTRGSTGLGLAVCHGIARDHGGSIRAANRPGGGAVFEVELPLAATAAGTVIAGGETNAAEAGRR
jgi:signal transduction histidine kinase